MKTIRFVAAAAAVLGLFSLQAQAQTEVQWWHSMTAVNGEWVNDLAKDFNASQKDYKIIPTYKGSYDESMTAAVAAPVAGRAPARDRAHNRNWEETDHEHDYEREHE